MLSLVVVGDVLGAGVVGLEMLGVVVRVVVLVRDEGSGTVAVGWVVWLLDGLVVGVGVVHCWRVVGRHR